ncbi:hypothetical protein FRC10_007984 [Ceratobasidium sp. 414]|nr:hypothetical protein FRC10_007984 [Ceratobasidium sp. 414]
MSSSVQIQARIEHVSLVTLSGELKNNTFNTHDVQSNTELVHQVLNLLSDQEDSVSIEKLALELPQDNVIAPRAVRKIVPAILRHVSDLTASSETLVRALTILDIVVRRFPTHICTIDPIVVPTSLFVHGDARVRKHAVRTAANAISSQPISNVQAFIETKILSCLGSSAAEVDEKLMAMDLILALAYHSIPNIEQVISSILLNVKGGDGRLKNAGLRVLEKLVIFFSGEMAVHVPELVAISTECIKHPAGSGEDTTMVDATGSNFDYSTDGMNDLGDDKIQCTEDDHTDAEAPYETRRLAIRLLSAVTSTNLKSLPKFFESAWHAIIISIGDHEPTIRQASHSGLVVLLRQAHKFVSDCSNFKPADRNRQFKPLPETEELLSALDKLVPELLAPILKVLSPSVTPHPATLMLLEAIIAPLPGGSPRSCLTRDGLKPFEDQLYKVLVQPGALRTFTYLIEHGFPDEDVRSELVELMHSSDPSVAAEAIRAGLEVIHRTCSEYCSIHDDDPGFPRGLQAEARRRMQDPHSDATIRKLSAKVIGALLVADFDCAEEDWELVRKMGATSVIRGAIKKTAEFDHQGYEFAEDWLQANVDMCIGIIRDGTDKDEGPSKEDAMVCLETLLWQLSNHGTAPSGIVDVILPCMSPTNPSMLDHSLQLLDSVLYYNSRNKTCLKDMEKRVSPRLFSLACESLPLSPHTALLQLMNSLATTSQAIAVKMANGLKSAFETTGDAGVAGAVSDYLVEIAKSHKSVAANIVENFAQHIERLT